MEWVNDVFMGWVNGVPFAEAGGLIPEGVRIVKSDSIESPVLIGFLKEELLRAGIQLDLI